MQGLDAALYTLDAPDFRDGTALLQGGDPGFFIQEMRIVDSDAPLDPADPGAPSFGLTLRAEGWFWPVGQTGVTGIQIGEIRIRGAILPLEIVPPNPRPVAGGLPIELTLHLRSEGRLVVTDTTLPPPPLPFGLLALALFDPGGRPGAGTLTGVTTGVNGAGLVDLIDSTATITYTPPGKATTDILVVALDDGADGLGVEIGRFSLNVQEK